MTEENTPKPKLTLPAKPATTKTTVVSSPKRIKWEYVSTQIIHADDVNYIENKLNAYGMEGWELVGTIPYGTTLLLLLKRPYVSPKKDKE